MYSQQEYEMVRRQTIQIESEKRALLRLLLLIVTVLLIVALVLLGFTYTLYRSHSNSVKDAESRAESLAAKLQQTEQELQDKTRQLEQSASEAARRQERIAALIPRVLSQTPASAEVAEFARAVYESPGRRTDVPRLPPNMLFQRLWRYRAEGTTQTFILVGGQVDGEWVIYSNLIAVTTH
jgi:outer membrane murein-binding lipoprotein Lpp